MVLTSDSVSTTKNDEVNSPSSDNKLPMEQGELEDIDTSLSTTTDEKQKRSSISSEEELSTTEKSISIPSEEMNKENLDDKRQRRSTIRSVSFAPTVEEIEIPSCDDSSFESTYHPIDFIDALV